MKITVRYGLIGGLLLSVWTLVFFLGAYQVVRYDLFFYACLLVQLVFVFLSVKSVKKIKYKDQIPYGPAVLSGFLTAFYMGLLACITVFLLNASGGTEGFVSEYLAQVETAMVESDMSSEEIDKALKVEVSNFKQWVMASTYLFQYVLFGLLFSLIFASILRKTGDTPSASEKYERNMNK